MHRSQTETRLHIKRCAYIPKMPPLLQDVNRVSVAASPDGWTPPPEISSLFPQLSLCPVLEASASSEAPPSHSPLRIGVVFSGGPAAGGHNVVAGLYDAMKQLDPTGVLFGFLNGPGGILSGEYIALESTVLQAYRNTGGFDLLGSGRVKLDTQKQLDAALEQVSKMQLSGLVVIGGDDSNTNAAVMAEHFLKKGCATRVIGVPKTIDGDLKNAHVEISFGFDTACKTYAEMIGNIQKDALSARKYYHFIRLMGRSASHIALECALSTQPNLAWIGEEISWLGRGLADLVAEIADLVSERDELGKHFGVILIPEGIVEWIPEMARLIQDLNQLLVQTPSLDVNTVASQLDPASLAVFALLPRTIQEQLLLHRDPHGNVQVSSIETEKLFVELVAKELKRREGQSGRAVPFTAVHHFFGYEGRSAFPSNFDCDYSAALGRMAALLVAHGKTGYMVFVKHLRKPPEQWELGAVPLCRLMHMEQRRGVFKPVIAKALVDKGDRALQHFQKVRSSHRLEDHYRSPGPIQFFGDPSLTDLVPETMVLNQGAVVVTEDLSSLQAKGHRPGKGLGSGL